MMADARAKTNKASKPLAVAVAPAADEERASRVVERTLKPGSSRTSSKALAAAGDAKRVASAAVIASLEASLSATTVTSTSTLPALAATVTRSGLTRTAAAKVAPMRRNAASS